MPPQEQQALRIAIAEDQEWKQTDGDKAAVKAWLEMTGENLGELHGLPNYTTSLDAIYAAVNTKDEAFRQAFNKALLGYPGLICNLTALDWCIYYRETLQELSVRKGACVSPYEGGPLPLNPDADDAPPAVCR
jgi:hypothetical protein